MGQSEQNYLDQIFDNILFQLSKGNTIDNLKKGVIWVGLQKVKEWESNFGYQVHIYSNDHLIDKKPHFHLIKQSEKINCRFFFDGEIYDCKGSNKVDKKIKKVIKYFLSKPEVTQHLIKFWNNKNPNYKIQMLKD